MSNRFLGIFQPEIDPAGRTVDKRDSTLNLLKLAKIEFDGKNAAKRFQDILRARGNGIKSNDVTSFRLNKVIFDYIFSVIEKFPMSPSSPMMSILKGRN